MARAFTGLLNETAEMFCRPNALSIMNAHEEKIGRCAGTGSVPPVTAQGDLRHTQYTSPPALRSQQGARLAAVRRKGLEDSGRSQPVRETLVAE